nr:hypothetical protein [Tanacetum cinerariifolium]
QPIPPAPVAPAGQLVAPEILAAHTAWIKGSKEIAGLMLMTMEPEIQRNLENLHENEMLKELKTLMHNIGKTVNELHAMLKLHEQTLPKNNAPALHAIRAGKVQKVNKHKKPQPQMAAMDKIMGRGKISSLMLPSPRFPLHLRGKIPQMTQYVISVVRHDIERGIVLNGFINCFMNNTIQVSRNNMTYFSAIPRDGIFKIDLSNSYTNESSIYDVSNKRAKLDLDSALLWHCRLVNISKKRIEKLQHDVLLNSTDLRALENCVSCMSGKMARKSYTHQVERAKDLLGLIHTDVCGPFKIMSRQGANYFVIFTDDFSQRRNRTLLDLVRSMMSQTTLSKSFWDYAPETAARILNMVSTKKVEKTPYEVWHGQAPKLSYLKFWGCEALVKRDTLDKSTRTRHPTDRMCLYIDVEEHELGDLGEPANYKVALLDLEFDKWLNAMNVEMQSIKDNETDMDGAVHTYKARLVANGYTQTLGIDYEETFSPVADIKAIRILISIAVYYDYEIWQMDVKTIFLNGYLSEEVYMEQPEGFVNPKYPNQ